MCIRDREMGLISDAGLFRLYMRYNGIDQQLEAGDFELAYSMTMPEICLLYTSPSPRDS